MYRRILECETPLRIIGVMGRQADLRPALAAIPVPPRHAAKLLGFVSRMAELLSAADLFVGKSGGLSIAEAAALRLPVVVLDPRE